MNVKILKHHRVKFEPVAYAQLCRQVLDRNGWKCQNCGRASELHVYHISFRSALGNDDIGNLITLCFSCHEMVHCSTHSRSD